MRKFERVTKVEGKTFATPQLVQEKSQQLEDSTPTSAELSGVEEVSEAAIQAAMQSIETSYPSRARVIVVQALSAAMPHLVKTARESGSLVLTEISEKATEAAAEAMYSLCGTNWHEIGYRLRWIFREDARTVLEAAAPHIQIRSIFWDDLAENMADPEFAKSYEKESVKITKILTDP